MVKLRYQRSKIFHLLILPEAQKVNAPDAKKEKAPDIFEGVRE